MALSKKEEKILASIVVASENNPERPEFPADDPKFPATPTYKINVQGFSDVWLKDESKNPTGTHKDRMAWEIVVSYREFLLAKKMGRAKGALPQMSIISSGSAAVAIQTMLRKYGLPNLKVLVDFTIGQKITKALEKMGCEIYETELGKKCLNWEEILAMTRNPAGFDITSSRAVNPATHFYDDTDPTTRFYDWLSYEILNNSPEYCFIPFGTGNLYENILNINRREVSGKGKDPRFRGDAKTLRRCNFLGATTNNPESKADKLYAPHLPFMHYDEQWIRYYKRAGFCGTKSDLHTIREGFIDRAMKIVEGQGIECEPSGIAGLALMLQMKNKLPKNKKMLIVNTGKTKYPE